MLKRYDSTVARIAGNIASGLIAKYSPHRVEGVDLEKIAEVSVSLARAIVAETLLTQEPDEPTT